MSVLLLSTTKRKSYLYYITLFRVNYTFRFPLWHHCANVWRRALATFDRIPRPQISGNAHSDHEPRRMYMKPGKFDGVGSLESFLAQFEVCACYNRWSVEDKGDFLRCALDKAAHNFCGISAQRRKWATNSWWIDYNRDMELKVKPRHFGRSFIIGVNVWVRPSDHLGNRHVNADVLSRKAWCECGEPWSADLTVGLCARDGTVESTAKNTAHIWVVAKVQREGLKLGLVRDSKWYLTARKFVERRNFTGPNIVQWQGSPVNYLLQKMIKAMPFVAPKTGKVTAAGYIRELLSKLDIARDIARTNIESAQSRYTQ